MKYCVPKMSDFWTKQEDTVHTSIYQVREGWCNGPLHYSSDKLTHWGE